MKLSAIFSDYDGTLARADVPILESKIPTSTDRALRSVAKRIPFALITMKDFDFIFPRTRYARGWACLGGLDIVLSSGTSFVRPHGHSADVFLDLVNSELSDSVRIERKMNSECELLGFSIDWRGRPRPDSEKLANLVQEASRRNLTVKEYPSQPFVDFYAGEPDKAKAVKLLKRELGVEGPVLYLGDSEQDNDAFKEAECGVCVYHGQSLDGVESEYVLKGVSVSRFLASLERARMHFTAALPGISRRGT